MTAAIGDGANDVAMIQEAHVGLGMVSHKMSIRNNNFWSQNLIIFSK